jgi:WD40 repeat protein
MKVVNLKIRFLYFFNFTDSLIDKEILIDKTFEFIEDEIKIRVESIRIELDNLQSQLIDECKKFRNNYLSKLKIDFDKAEKKFQDYENLLSNNLKSFELVKLRENIYSCQNFVKEIQNYDSNFSQNLKKFSFISSEWIPDFPVIGRLNQNTHIDFELMKKTDLEIINFENTVKSLNRIFSLNDQTLLLSSSDDNTIIQLDDKYNEIRRINTIQQHRLITPLSLCSDGYENIYICDLGNNCVLITDYEFSRIKRIIGKKSLDCGQPIEPLDICFHSDSLYVLNKDSSYVTVFSRIGDFDRQMELYASIKTDNTDSISTTSDIVLNRPNRIGANSKILVVLDSFRKVYLYDCLNGQLKQVIKSHNSTIMCLIDDYLFTCNRDGSLICYQSNNNKYVQMFERVVDLLKDSKSYMCFFKNRILVALTDSKSIVAL